MFGTLFGAEMPLAVRFFLAFLIVLGLIGVTAWAVRRFGVGRLRGTALRGRQPRLAVIDYATVDARRRLILVRRDNVEHLLIIGGPTDVVVESTIVRAAGATRENAVTRPAVTTEMLPRAIPLPDASSWPLQPEPAAPRPAPRIEPLPEEPMPAAPQHGEPPPRPPRESLAALAEEISARPTPPRNRPAPGGRLRYPAEPRIPQMNTGNGEAPADTDQALAEMAQRLEAALRKPKAPADGREAREIRAPAPRAAPPPPPAELIGPQVPPPEGPPSAPAPQLSRGAERKPPRPAPAASQQGKTLYDSLEQEMASLLGRPGKT
jgi:flagellar protein FliO/FliZ